MITMLPLSTFLNMKVKKLCPGLPWWLTSKESACQCRGHRFHPWSGKISDDSEQWSPGATATEARAPGVRDLQHEKAPWWDPRVPQLERSPTHHNQRRTVQPKLKKKFVSWNFQLFYIWWMIENFNPIGISFGTLRITLSISNFFGQKPFAGKNATWDNYGFRHWVCFLKVILIYDDSAAQSPWLTLVGDWSSWITKLCLQKAWNSRHYSSFPYLNPFYSLWVFSIKVLNLSIKVSLS